MFSFTSSASDLVLREILNLSKVEAERLGFDGDSCDVLNNHLSTSQPNEYESNDVLGEHFVETMSMHHQDSPEKKLKRSIVQKNKS